MATVLADISVLATVSDAVAADPVDFGNTLAALLADISSIPAIDKVGVEILSVEFVGP